MVRAGLNERVTSEQRFEGGEEVNELCRHLGKTIPAEERISAKARRQIKLGMFKE